MASPRSWTAFPATYRAEEMATLAGWIPAGISGSVAGLPGSGKSNLLGFLVHRPDVLQTYLPSTARPVALVSLDLNDLPTFDIATLYRLILRSFYESSHRFDDALAEVISDVYLDLSPKRAARDPFVTQSVLREVLARFRDRDVQVVMLLDHLDRCLGTATPDMFSALRGLRDSFRGTLSYIVGVRHEISRQFSPADLGEMYELVDTHVCWVGAMSEADAMDMIAREMAGLIAPPDQADAAHLIALTGGYPALLKAACHWWRNTAEKPALPAWKGVLLAQPSIQSRLTEMLDALTEEERHTLSLVRVRVLSADEEHPPPDLRKLAAMGLCKPAEGGWCINGDLTATFLPCSQVGDAGGIWLDEVTGELYKGQTPLRDLTPLAKSVLRYLVRHPRVQHTKTDLITNAWPDQPCREGVSDASVYQVIREVRSRIEADPSQPCHIITWRGYPEGGYQFFPEGRPGEQV